MKKQLWLLTDESLASKQDRKHLARILDDNFASVFAMENMECIPVLRRY